MRAMVSVRGQLLIHDKTRYGRANCENISAVQAGGRHLAVLEKRE